ncbi:hypothetical protein MSAS_36220 [Mycobacterium saskatchewanense]|nr:hypothetical protein [Mycobacterium saskatchewanense]BBX64448.1 hypothetical protein MSAS_36220 [Mycobacterium saskatchewanense]
MAFTTAHRFSGASLWRGIAGAFSARCRLTPEERANLYVSRMPIAVVTASLGGHPSAGPGDHR